MIAQHSTSRVRAWAWRKWWAWKLRKLEPPYPVPGNEHEDAMNEMVVMGAMGRGPVSGRAGW